MLTRRTLERIGSFIACVVIAATVCAAAWVGYATVRPLALAACDRYLESDAADRIGTCIIAAAILHAYIISADNARRARKKENRTHE